MTRLRIAVVGAGVTGLVCARELAREGHAVRVFERWPDVGGQASAFDLGGGVWLERYYHHFFETDAEMIALHDELLPGALDWYRSSVGMYRHGRVWPFVTPADLLRYGPLPLPDRLRLGLALLRLQRVGDWRALDDIAALDWFRRTCGERVVDEVWLPLLLGKFGDDAPSVPLAWLWSKVTLRRRLKGRGAARELLGYPRGSFRAISVALAREIERHGGTVHVDRAVRRVERDGDDYVLRCAAPGAHRLPQEGWDAAPEPDARADVVVLTTPTHVTRALADWPEDYAAALAAWSYRTAVVLLLELRRPFSETYWVNIAEPGMPFLGLIEHTNLVPAERYPARYLYVSNYVAASDELRHLSTEELFARYLPALSRVNRTFVEEDVLRCWSFREDAAQPVPRIGDRKRLLPMRTPRPGLFVANTTQIYPEDRGTNYSVRLGREAAAAVRDWLEGRS